MTARQPILPTTGYFACVVDEHPRFHLEALRWFASLTVVAEVSPNHLIVHNVGSDESDVLGFLRRAGVSVRHIDRFDPRSPHCNKISGALRLAKESLEGVVVLCDTDIAVMDDPRQLDLASGSFAAKVVDAPVPPLDVLLRVFAIAGLQSPATIALPWGSGDHTLMGNSNGGFYLVPGGLLTELAKAWAHWATWLLDRIELLEEWRVHVDQVAMALAITAEGIPIETLAVRWNTPTHDPTRIPAEPEPPSVVHYHQNVDRRGLIEATGHASIDERIATANEAIGSVWARAAPQATYARWLGATPRTDEIASLVATLLDTLRPTSILDVGADSGIEWGQWRSCLKSLDWWDDLVAALESPEANADLVVCLEEPRHAPHEAELRDLLHRLWKVTTRVLVVRGPRTPESDGRRARGTDAFVRLLDEATTGAELYPVGGDDKSGTFVAVKESETKHPRDFGAHTLAPLLPRHPNPRALLELRVHAFGSTGFYPDHAPRLWEYPVVAGLVAEHLSPGSRLVDVGAGVTPLAPYLTSLGYVVETVDPSSVVRTWPPQPDWNEWDFLDYGAVGLAHRSWNCTLDQVPSQPPFDGAYSISVIEHLPANVRRNLLRDISKRTALGGLVLLTIDLVRGSDDLWNRNLGVIVEPIPVHGTFDDVVNECTAVGLELLSKQTIREWGDTKVDIGLLALRKTAEPASPAPRGTRQRIMGLVRPSRR